MIQSKKMRKRLLLLTLALVMALGSIPVASFASDEEIRVTVNGAAANYAPGSVLVLYGRLESGEVGLPDTAVAIKARIGNSGSNFYISQATTDSDGYFKAGFNIPKTASAGQKLYINVDGADMSPYTLKAQATINSDDSTDGAFALLGFVQPGYLQGETVRKIAASTTQLGIVFNKNVNYFNNKNADTDLKNLGINVKNKDCFRLYKGETGTEKVDIDIELLESGGTTTAQYTKLDGTIASEQKKDIIYIDLEESLVAGTTYRLVIDEDLTSNSSSTLGADQTIYFTTASSSGGSSGSGGTATDTAGTTDSGSSDTTVTRNDIALDTTPSISGGTASVVPTDSQIATGLKSVVDGQKNVLTIALTEDDFAGAGEEIGEVNLSLTSSQVATLSESVSEVVYDTPIGNVVIPKEVLAQTSGNISLNVQKTGEEDSFQVTLTDASGKVTRLSGRVSLVLPIENTENNVVFHNGVIMKNGWIEDGKIYAVTTGFSVFSAGQNEVTFADINGHWAKDSIEFLAARAIIAGAGENTFAPDKSVTRFEFVKMLVGAFDEIDAAGTETAGFTDVQAGFWYTDAVNWAAKEGIVQGTGENLFGGSLAITREDLAVILYRLAEELEIDLDTDAAKVTFSDDAGISAYAKEAVYAMQQAGILNGKSENRFDPAGYATRAETSAILTAFIKTMTD